MTVAWPSTLPDFVRRDGWRLTMRDGRIATPMDNGPPKMRRRFSYAVRQMPVSFMTNATGVTNFEAFWDTTTGGGVLPFTKSNPTDSGETFTMIFAPENSPEISDLGGGNFQISFLALIL